MATLPGRSELRRLSLRAMVAYAARNARRVQGLVRRARLSESVQRTVERAIVLAEHFAAGDVRGAAVVSFTAIEPVTTDAGASRAADSAACAAYAAAAAADARTSLRTDAYADAAACAAFRATGDPALVTAAREDYSRLRCLGADACLSLGRPINCTERGPLGPLWPAEPQTVPDRQTAAPVAFRLRT